MDKNLVQRALSGIVYVLVIFLCTTSYGAQWINQLFGTNVHQYHIYYGLIVFFIVVGVWECIRVMQFGNGYEKWVVYPVAAIVLYMFSKRYFGHGFIFDFRLNEILALSLILIASITVFKFASELYYDSGKLIFTVIYAALPFCFALGLPKYSKYADTFSHEVFFLFVLIWSSDTFAYLVGKFFGKHKMAPKVSPKKTWEGYIGGVVLTLIIGFLIEKFGPNLRGNWMIVGFLVATFAPLGDLVESQLKRNFGVKDSGNILPGHGGVLDRLDSFIISAPVVYLYFILQNLF